jgi:hypothetical protein
MNRFMVLTIAFALSAGTAAAGEKALMHCFAFTPIKEATQAEWDAFYKATDELPGKIKGLKRVWYGKLMRPLALPALAMDDAAARKALMETGKGTASVTINRREHGVCMEFADEAAFKAYGPDSAHKQWESVYSKVRVAGTTTYQIIGQ